MPTTVETFTDFCKRQDCPYHQDGPRQLYTFENGATAHGYQGNIGFNEAPPNPKHVLKARIQWWGIEGQARLGNYELCKSNIATIINWHKAGHGPALDPRNFDTLRQLKKDLKEALDKLESFTKEYADKYQESVKDFSNMLEEQKTRADSDIQKYIAILNS